MFVSSILCNLYARFPRQFIYAEGHSYHPGDIGQEYNCHGKNSTLLMDFGVPSSCMDRRACEQHTFVLEVTSNAKMDFFAVTPLCQILVKELNTSLLEGEFQPTPPQSAKPAWVPGYDGTQKTARTLFFFK
jgi:hypothetical protein